MENLVQRPQSGSGLKNKWLSKVQKSLVKITRDFLFAMKMVLIV